MRLFFMLLNLLYLTNKEEKLVENLKTKGKKEVNFILYKEVALFTLLRGRNPEQLKQR
jgi:hypothetical protein